MSMFGDAYGWIPSSHRKADHCLYHKTAMSNSILDTGTLGDKALRLKSVPVFIP